MRMNGGQWFFFGWDQRIDEIGFLTCILSVTLTLYDDIEAEMRRGGFLIQKDLKNRIETGLKLKGIYLSHLS